MQIDFHYYATYSAAVLAGYTHEESQIIAYSAQFVDCCSRTFLKMVGAPLSAATTQLQLELMDARTDPVGLQDITRIWSSFHFLPGDLKRTRKHASKAYIRKMRLVCDTNGELLKETVGLAMGRGLEAAGLAMHVLADTWAHRYFAGTPSLVINNTNHYFYEIYPDEQGVLRERPVKFNNNPASTDVPEKGYYTNSLFQWDESSIMNLGHGRAGHLPDYSFARYKYLPAWGEYKEILKDNPHDFYHAFCQMIYALECIREEKEFALDTYAFKKVAPYGNEIMEIILKRRLDASADWKAFGEKLSGQEIEDFDVSKYQQEYMDAGNEHDETFLGKFVIAAMRQKSMVTNRIFKSGSLLAGYSIDFDLKNFTGIKDLKGIGDFMHLIEDRLKGVKDDEEKKDN